ncbi:MAG: hypothetical protein HXY18_12615 [Bryobacteraceae bacterium]|nr:hypothetical protein [Bryobacteraceae bacterium]
MIEEAKEHFAAVSISALMGHAVRPLEDEPVQPGAVWSGSVQAKLTGGQWTALTAPGTELNRRWLPQLDVVARHLKRLHEAVGLALTFRVALGRRSASCSSSPK